MGAGQPRRIAAALRNRRRLGGGPGRHGDSPGALAVFENKPTLTTAAGSGQPSRAAPAYVKSDPQIVYAVAALLVQQKQWKRALPHAQKLVELTPGQVGPRQLVENIRRQLAAVPAPR
jgi:hypothetical protein